MPGATAYFTRDAANKLKKNLVIFRLPRATLVAAFAGLNGTYEANRPHFVDVLKTLYVADPAVAPSRPAAAGNKTPPRAQGARGR